MSDMDLLTQRSKVLALLELDYAADAVSQTDVSSLYFRQTLRSSSLCASILMVMSGLAQAQQFQSTCTQGKDSFTLIYQHYTHPKALRSWRSRVSGTARTE